LSNSCFFAFDFTPDLCNSFHDHGAKAGVIDLHVGFAEALPKNITCICYATFKEIITINKNKQHVIYTQKLVGGRHFVLYLIFRNIMKKELTL